MATPIVFLDTETTGLHADRRVWEIGMIRRDDDFTGDRERRFFVKNPGLATAEPYALKIGGFYNRHPQYNGRDADPNNALLDRYEAAKRVEEFTRDAIIVGINPLFDLEVLGKMMRSLDLRPAWHYQPVDLPSVAIGWLAARGVHVDLPTRSEDLAAMCLVKPGPDEDRHTALGDARWTRDWWDAIQPDQTDPGCPGCATDDPHDPAAPHILRTERGVLVTGGAGLSIDGVTYTETYTADPRGITTPTPATLAERLRKAEGEVRR